MSIPRDDNRVPVIFAPLNTDGTTPTAIVIGNGHTLQVSDGTTGTDHSPRPNDLRDQNRVTGLMGVSSADGVTPTEIYADSSGNLLIKST